jgi:uncharacterized protein DUF2846
MPLLHHATSRRRALMAPLVLSLVATLGACDVFYFAEARLPLVAPVDDKCLRSKIANGPQRWREADVIQGEGRPTVVAHSTPSMFHNHWDIVAQVVERDSGVYRDTIYRDSSASLRAGYVQVNRRFEAKNTPLVSAELARLLLEVRDACGGQSPKGERVFSAVISGHPYRMWVVPGTKGRVAMRLTADSVRYFGPIQRNTGRQVLHLDTLSQDSDSRRLVWLQADSVELPPKPKGTTVATNCWHGDSPETGDLLVFVKDTDTPYHSEVVAAWTLDAGALRLQQISGAGIECRNDSWGSVLTSAPRALRAAALTFHPQPGRARVYAYLSRPDFPAEFATPHVAVDGRRVGRLEGGAFLMVEVEPGRHRVSSPAGRHESAVWIDAVADSAYFVELRKKTWAWSWRASVKHMDPVRARAAIRRAQMVPSSWPGATPNKALENP